MNLALYSSNLILLLNIAVHAEEHEPLIFDRFTESLFLLPNTIPKDLECGAWAVACPAETPAEKDFVKANSFTKNALIVKEICNRGNKASEVKKLSCKEPYKISMSYRLRLSVFHFGYEVYYDLGDEKYFHRNNNFGEYRRAEEVIPIVKKNIRIGIYAIKEMYRIAMKTAGIGVKELWLNEDKRMGFMWLYLFKIKFDLSKKILKHVWYEIDENNRWTAGEQCNDYRLGHELFEETNIDSLYLKQETLFKDSSFPSDRCDPNYICFVKWLLIPIDQFRFGPASPPVCSNMATIPIWKYPVENIMKKVDTFLYSLFRELNEPLSIVSGVIGEIQHPKAKRYSIGKTIFYFDPEHKKVPIPKIIYKIVEYKVKECNEEEMSCWYSAIIVVHNDFDLKDSDKLCPSPVTADWGWDEITKDFSKEEIFRNTIYVCENNAKIQKKLSLGSREKVAGGLSLKNFPFFNKETMRMDEKGRFIKANVENRYREFRGRGDIQALLNNKVIERSHIESNVIDPEAQNEAAKDEANKEEQNK